MKYPSNFILNNLLPLNKYWHMISISYNGKHLTIIEKDTENPILPQNQFGYIYVSTDFGKTWIQKKNDRNGKSMYCNWMYVHISGCGKFQTAITDDDIVYMSHDSGKNWENLVTLSKNQIGKKMLSNTNSQSIATSYNGSYQTIIIPPIESDEFKSHLFTSDNYGKEWKKYTNIDNQIWKSVAMSYCGGKQVAITYSKISENSPGKTYISDNYGLSWIQLSSISDYFTCIAMSSDGKYITAGACHNNVVAKPLYTSCDGGATWITLNNIVDNWSSITMTGDGKYQSALSYLETKSYQMWHSEDYGNTWTLNKNIVTNSWKYNKISGNGYVHYIIPANNSGAYYARIT